MRAVFYLLAFAAILAFILSAAVPVLALPGLGSVRTDHLGWAALIASWVFFLIARSQARRASPTPPADASDGPTGGR